MSTLVEGPDGADSALVETLVLANHILFIQGVLDAFGHVSVRHDKRPDRFLLSRSLSPSEVTAGDIRSFTLDGEIDRGGASKVYLERFIHSEIYRRSPAVRAIVHSHSAAVLPFTVAKQSPLRAVMHMAGFVGVKAPVFDVADAGVIGSDLLIGNKELGAELANCFDGNDIVLMRGHGLTIVGPDLKLAVYRAIYANHNARCQLEAARLGEVTYLTAEEAATCKQTVEADVERPWHMWQAQAKEWREDRDRSRRQS